MLCQRLGYTQCVPGKGNCRPLDASVSVRLLPSKSAFTHRCSCFLQVFTKELTLWILQGTKYVGGNDASSKLHPLSQPAPQDSSRLCGTPEAGFSVYNNGFGSKGLGVVSCRVGGNPDAGIRITCL